MRALPLTLLLGVLPSTGCLTVQPVAQPLPPLTRELATSPADAYAAALRVGLNQRYDVVTSDAAGGIVQFKRLHVFNEGRRFARRGHVDYLTLAFESTPGGTRTTLQMRSVTLPDSDNPAEVPVREDDASWGPTFLDRLAAALSGAPPAAAPR